MKKFIGDVIVVSLIYTLAYCFQVFVLVPFNSHERVSVFFFPAAVRMMCTMIYGYRAGIGITLGALLFYCVFDDTGLDNKTEYMLVAVNSGLACSLALFVWAGFSKKILGLRNPRVAFKSINALDVFQFCLIQAIIDTMISHTVFMLYPNIMPDQSFYWMVMTFVGNLTGAYLVFISLNLTYSLGKRLIFFISDHRHKS